MKRIFIISILLCLISSCREAEETFSEEELARRDSLALHVAVFPTLETLPLYYAERSGLFDEVKTDIRLLHYESMVDCDTAISRGHADVSFTDVVRILTLWQEDSCALRAIASTPSSLALFSPKDKKINRIEQLKERLIGLERHSRSDFWSDEILKGTDLSTLDLFRVQIGSTALRYEMLMNGLLDAAFLPQPYSQLCNDTTLANCLWQQPDSLTSWTVMAIPTRLEKDSLRQQQTKALLDVYEKARRRLIARPDTALLHIIYKEEFGIKDRQLQRTHWYEWAPAPLDSTFEQAQGEARQWLIERGKLK